MTTFQELTQPDLPEVRANDPIITPFDALSRLEFAVQSLHDILRHYAACKITETEAMDHSKLCLVNIANLAQHAAESLGLCVPDKLQAQISEDFRNDTFEAIQWLAKYINENKTRVRSTQLGGDARFAVEFDSETLHSLFELAKGEEDE